MDKASEPGATAPKASVSPKKDAPAEKKDLHELVREHVSAHAKNVVAHAEREEKRKDGDEAKAFDGPLLVSEHAAELEPWQKSALLARFHAHGLRHDTRIPKGLFEAALDEVLKGRV